MRCWLPAELVTLLHTITSRRIPRNENAVLSVTRISEGQSHNVLPSAVELTGTVRSFDAGVQDTIESSIRQVAEGVAHATGTKIEVEYLRYYPATVNTPQEADLALRAAQSVGLEVALAPAAALHVRRTSPSCCSARPGAYLWLGQGRRPGEAETPTLHHPSYDFNDEALPLGVAWFVAMALLATSS